VKKLSLWFSLLPLLIACQTTSISSSISTPSERILINNYVVGVEESVKIIVTFTGTVEPVEYTFEGDDIRILSGGYIRGHRSNTTTRVTAITTSLLTTSFDVFVEGNLYQPVSTFEQSEGWMNPIVIDPIASLTRDRDFPMGIDISTVKDLYDQGGQFYNEFNQSESLFFILKRHGVNYIRIRLWNDPFNRFLDTDGQEQVVPYGGGINDLDTTLDIAIGAKAAGLKILLNFHFSDFWADPGKQVIPKAWAELPTVEAVGQALKEFVQNTLTVFQEHGALPDMVQIGNETTPGLFTSAPGPVNTELTGGDPYYISQRTTINSAIRGQTGSSNFYHYIEQGLAGVKAVSDDILTVIHLARGFANANNFINYYQQFAGLDYDIIGLSAYSFYHFQTGFTTLKSTLQTIAQAFPDKLISLVETSYAFTYAPHPHAANIFSRNGGQELTGYPVTVQGQANNLREVIASIADIENGYGVFYWEGAWIPVERVGWADRRSKNTWANQALFTYDGKPLPSLSVFNDVWSE
jgi:arabinogalactan endo-1,4-beta-galactosidase